MSEHYSLQEKEVLLAFIEANLKQAGRLLTKAEQHVAAARMGKRSINPQLLEDVAFWQRLRDKFL